MSTQWKWILFFTACFLWIYSEEAVFAQTDNRTISEIFDDRNSESPEMEESESTTSSEEDQSVMEERSIFSVLFQLIIALAAVIAVMYFLLKFINKRTQRFQSHQTMQNLGGVPLGQNKSVQLIKVGERLLVVGVGESIQLLKEIEEEEEIAELLPREEEYPWKQKGTALWNRLRKPISDPSHHRSSSFQQLLEKQLMDMKQTRKKAREQVKENNK